MISDWVRLLAVAAMICVAGVFGILEAAMNERRRAPGGGYPSVRGAAPWLVVIFAIDGTVTFAAYTFLDAALSDEFWGNPVLIYVIAFAVSPLILRFEVDFAIPSGPRAKEIMTIIPTARRFLSDRVGTASARYRTMWLTRDAIPAVTPTGVPALSNFATTFFRNATHLDPSVRDLQVEAVRRYRGDRKATPDQRALAVCQVLIDYGGLGSLKDFVKSCQQASQSRES